MREYPQRYFMLEEAAEGFKIFFEDELYEVQLVEGNGPQLRVFSTEPLDCATEFSIICLKRRFNLDQPSTDLRRNYHVENDFLSRMFPDKYRDLQGGSETIFGDYEELEY